MNEYVIYFGRFELPDKNALAHRVKANAIALKNIGYRPILVGYTKTLKSTSDESVLKTDGIEYYQAPYPSSPIEWIKDYKTYKKIERIVKSRGPQNIKAIICTGVGPGNLNGLLNISKKYKIPIAYDVVDWFAFDQGNSILRLYKKSEDWYLRRIIEPKILNYICISSFLGEHYSKTGRNIVVIPSLTFSDDERFNTQSSYIASNRIEICYAGSPGYKGAKDKINWVVRAFNEINHPNSHLSVYGIEKEAFFEQFPELEAFRDNQAVTYYGRRPNQECIEAIKKSDFFAFARTVDRMTTAGFPTKYSECSALQTPVITTPTSDLREYVINNKNGFLADDCTYEAFKEAMMSALDTSTEQRTEMHKLQSALDESYWEKRIADFIDSLLIE